MLSLNGRSEISEDLLAQFADYGVTVVGISGDISNGEDAQRMVAEAIEKLGSVDVLVNNAGITNDKLMLKMTEEDFERVLKINLTGAFNMTQAVLKPMSKAPSRGHYQHVLCCWSNGEYRSSELCGFKSWFDWFH